MPASEAPIRITDRNAAERFVRELIGTMRELSDVLARESDAVRAGRLRDAFHDAERKTALSGAYVVGLETAKSNAISLARFAPAAIDALKSAHKAFAASVETNQAVLATARTVSEGLIRNLADELGKSRTPTIYGTPSRPPSPYGRGPASGPLLVSRSL